MSPLSNEYSPSTLVTGQPQPSYKEPSMLSFGGYAEVYTANNIINNNEERTTSSIALYPSHNAQGGWMFMSLSTRRILHRRQWKKVQITKKVVNRMEEIGNKEKQDWVSRNFKYKWNDGELTDDETHEQDESENKQDNTSGDSSTGSMVSIKEFH